MTWVLFRVRALIVFFFYHHLHLIYLSILNPFIYIAIETFFTVYPFLGSVHMHPLNKGN